MVVHFSSIELRLQKSVLYKLKFDEFARLSQCSKYSGSLYKNLERRLLYYRSTLVVKQNDAFVRRRRKRLEILQYIYEFPVKLTFHEISFVETQPTAFITCIELYESGKIHAGTMLSFALKVEPFLFNRFLKVSQIRNVVVFDLQEEYLHQPEFAKIPKLKFRYYEIDFEIVLNLTATKIHVETSDFTSKQLNEFFKQWNTGRREIDNFYFCSKSVMLHCENDEEIFSGIQFELIWSQSYHRNSIVSSFSKRNVKRNPNFNKKRFYSLKRGDEELLLQTGERCGTNIFIATRVDNVFKAFQEIFQDYWNCWEK